MSTEKLFGERLLELREERKISRSKLAAAMMVTTQAVGKWERGESLPDVLSLKRLADILGVRMEAFFFSADDYNIEDYKSKQWDIDPNPIEPKLTNSRNAWNLSMSNWVDADFSGLRDIAERFSCSNINNCNLSNSTLSSIVFKANRIKNCNFSGANLSSSKLTLCSINKNCFNGTSFNNAAFSHCSIIDNDFTAAEFAGAKFEFGQISGCSLPKTRLSRIDFSYTLFNKLEIETDIESSSFVGCHFKQVAFKNLRFTNTFFKNNKHKKCTFENCTADNISYAFLASDKFDLTGITLVPGEAPNT